MGNMVKFFSNSTLGCPALNQVQGGLLTLLDAVLVDGFQVKAPDSFSVSAGLGTLTYPSAPGYEEGQVLALSGAATSQHNVQWRVLSVSGVEVTVNAEGFPDEVVAPDPVFSTKVAPLGFEKLFSGTNTAAYRSLAIDSTRMILRVDDSVSTTYANVRGFETMASIDDLTGPMFPTSAQRPNSTWGKSGTWTIIGDDRFFYFTRRHVSTPDCWSTHIFGDILPHKVGDGTHCALSSATGLGENYYLTREGAWSADYGSGSAPSVYLARAIGQVGGSSDHVVFTTGDLSPSNNPFRPTYPSSADNSLIVVPGRYVVERATKALRGELPGAFWSPQVVILANGLKLANVLSGRDLRAIYSSDSNWDRTWFVDATGPWR